MYNLRNETINIEIIFTNYSSTTDVTLPLVALRMPTRGTCRFNEECVVVENHAVLRYILRCYTQ